MVDICERLDAAAKEWIAQGDDDPLEREAAAEIRRLRDVLAEAQEVCAHHIEITAQNGRDYAESRYRAGIEAAAKAARNAFMADDRKAVPIETIEAAIRALADAPKSEGG